MAELNHVMSSMVSLFAANTVSGESLAAFAGGRGLWRDEVPPDAGLSPLYPYAIIESGADSERALYRSCENQYWMHTISVALYDVDKQKCEAHVANFTSIFDRDDLYSLAVGSMVRVEREEVGYLRPDKKVAYARLRYTYLTTRTRTDMAG